MNIDFYEANSSCTRIVVVGIGGGGCNSVNRMIDAGVSGVEFIAVNTDKQALRSCRATKKIVIGEKLTGGRGAGAVPEVGEKAAIESEDLIKESLKSANMVFIAAGMGGGTGTGAAPIIAKIAKDLGCLTVGVVTRPFEFEKKVKGRLADDGIKKLRDSVDALIIISNQALLNENEDISLIEAWRRADDVLKQGVQGISDLIINPGEINIDFKDVETVMKNKGCALMGVGVGKGENAAVDAVTMAIENPLMPDLVVDKAKAILVNVAGSTKMKLKSFHDVMKFIDNIASEEAHVITGQSFNDSLEDMIKVTIVATDFDEFKPEKIKIAKEEPEAVETKKTENVYSHDEFIKLLQSGNKNVGKIYEDIEEPAYLRNLKKKDKADEDNNYLLKKN